MKIAVSNICSAFEGRAIGTRVLCPSDFLTMVEVAVGVPEACKELGAPGQYMVSMPREATRMVSGGVGRRRDDPEDYVLREHRGRVQAFLKRDRAESPSAVDLIVYSRDAYLSDPQVVGEETQRIKDEEATHVIVAVLAHCGEDKPPVDAWRFVVNLAGGNKSYSPEEFFENLRLNTPLEHRDSFRKGVLSALDVLRGEAQDISEYWDQWAVVAD